MLQYKVIVDADGNQHIVITGKTQKDSTVLALLQTNSSQQVVRVITRKRRPILVEITPQVCYEIGAAGGDEEIDFFTPPDLRN